MTETQFRIIAPDFRKGTDFTCGAYSVIGENVIVGNGVSIGHNVILSDGVRLGDNVTVESFTFVGRSAVIGAGTKVGTHCKIGEGVMVGERCSFTAYCEIRDQCTVGDEVKMGSRCTLSAGAIVGDQVIIKYGFVLTDTPVLSRSGEKSVGSLGRGSRFGANVTIMPGVTIGEDAEIGACSQVRKDVPSGEIWFGQPARFHKRTCEI